MKTLIIEVLVTFEVPTGIDADEEDAAVNRVLNRIMIGAGKDDVQEPEIIVHDIYEWENE